MTRKEAIDEQHRLFPHYVWSREEPAPGRKEVTYHWGHSLTLPEICLDLRMSVNGAADPWDTDQLKQVRNMLVARVATWDRQREDKIDKAIFDMVCEAATLAAIELERREREGVPA